MLFAICAASGVAALPDAGGRLIWQQNVNGTANGTDTALCVAVDNQGNVVAAGFTENTGAGGDFTVAKFDRDSTLLWRQTLNGTANGFDQASSVAVDNQGNVAAAGFTENAGTSRDFTVVKFDRNGTLLWRQTLNGTANRWDWASSVAVDNRGNVVAAGVMDDRGTFGDFTVAKFDRDGTLLWQKPLNGTANASDDGGSVVVDSEGNVVAAGVTYNTGTGADFRVAKFDRDGTLRWQQTLNGSANGGDKVDSVAVDNKGNVVVAGFTTNTGTGADFTVARFDRDGTLLWRQTVTGTGGDGEASSVAVDNQGNVVVAGLIQYPGNSFDFTVAKFDRDGTLLWQQTISGTANSLDWALSVGADNQGNVVAAGFTTNAGYDQAFTVAKFDRDGALLWQHNLDGTANRGQDRATSMALDHEGHPVVAGSTQNTSTGFSDFTVMKFER